MESVWFFLKDLFNEDGWILGYRPDVQYNFDEKGKISSAYQLHNEKHKYKKFDFHIDAQNFIDSLPKNYGYSWSLGHYSPERHRHLLQS